MSQKTFCFRARDGIVTGLAQKMGVNPQAVLPLTSLHSSARVLTIKLNRVNPHYLAQIIGMADQFTMWAGLDDKHPIRIGWAGSNILIEVPYPPAYWQKVTLEQLERYHYLKSGAVATIGLGLQREAMRVDFRRADMAHLFITGQTRSGKTNTQRLIGWNLAHHCPDSQMIIFDVAKRGYNWSDFGNVANLAHPVIKDLTEADKVLAWASQEIERRADQGRKAPKTFLLVDELKALVDDSKLASDYLARIASVGGEFGLHLILSTQYPQIKMLGSAEIKRNVTTRLCGKVDDARSAENALGIAGSGANTLQGYGDFLLKDSDGLSRLTVAKIEPAHVAQLPRSEAIPALPLPDSDQVNGGPPQHNEPMCVEPEHAALALIEPMGIGRLRDEIVNRGLADSFSKDRAKRTKDFAEAQRKWIQANSPESCAFDFLGCNWIEL